MCKALRDMMKDGKKEGIEESNLRFVQNIMEGLHVSLEQAMTLLKLSPEEREYCQKVLAASAG